MNTFLRGAVGGTIATVPMTAAMLFLNSQIPDSERESLPPERITENLANDLGIGELVDDGPKRKAVALVNHFTFGAAAGGLYGSIESHVPLSPVVKGVGYGLSVWAASYLGWLPAADLVTSATDEPASHNAMMTMAHVVWGAALGASVNALSKSNSNKPRR